MHSSSPALVSARSSLTEQEARPRARTRPSLRRARLTDGPTVRGDAMNQRFSFTSLCPRCGFECVIETYTRGELLRLLDFGCAIEARRAECNVHWPIGPEARVQIARLVAASISAWRQALKPTH